MGIKRASFATSDAIKARIFELSDDGASGRAIARQLSLSHSAVNGFIRDRKKAAQACAPGAATRETEAPATPPPPGSSASAVGEIARRAELVTRKILSALSVAASGRPTKNKLDSMDLARVARVAVDFRKLETLLAGGVTSRSASVSETAPGLTPEEAAALETLERSLGNAPHGATLSEHDRRILDLAEKATARPA